MYFPGSKFIGLSLRPDEISLTENGTPYINAEPIAYTTLNSWEETSNESINFDSETELAGPLPIILAVESIAGQAQGGQKGFIQYKIQQPGHDAAEKVFTLVSPHGDDDGGLYN